MVFLVGSVAVAHSAPKPRPRTFEKSEPEPDEEATAPPSSDPHFAAGLRSGFGFPFGKVRETATAGLGDVFKGQVPIWVDVGVRFVPWTVGLYFSYGFGVLGSRLADECDQVRQLSPGIDASCSASDLRIGLTALERHLERRVAHSRQHEPHAVVGHERERGPGTARIGEHQAGPRRSLARASPRARPRSIRRAAVRLAFLRGPADATAFC